MKPPRSHNKLGTYLSVTLGVGCIATVAEGAVTWYGFSSANDTNPDPLGINIGDTGYGGGFAVNSNYTAGIKFALVFGNAYHTGYSAYFFQKGDTPPAAVPDSYVQSWGFGYFYGSSAYSYLPGMIFGATYGSNNYASIDFNDDGVFEAVGRFYFDIFEGVGQAYLVAIATTNEVLDPTDLSTVGGPALSLADGMAMIPEPSSLALLALGSAGLLARRNRKKVA